MTALGRRTSAAEMPKGALWLRWAVSAIALSVLCFLVVLHPPARPGYLLLFAAAMILADVFFMVRVAPGAYFSFSPAFLFVYFLIAGSTGAALLTAVAHLGAWGVQLARKRTLQSPSYALSDASQHVLAALAGGGLVFVALRISVLFRGLPRALVPATFTFAAGYFIAFAILASAAVWLRSGSQDVRRHLWPTTVLWTAISFLVSIPFALTMRIVAPAIGGFVLAAVFTFAVLAGISVILRLNAKLQSGNSDLKAINSIGTLITATLEPSEIFGIIARESRRVLLWDGFFIALGGGDESEIEMIFLSEQGEELARRRLPRGAGLTGRAIDSGEVVHYGQGEDEQEIEDDDTFRGRRRPKSLVIAPMRFGDDVMGAICVQSYKPDVYGVSQIQLLQTIAGQAAIAVRNAQLFQSEKQATSERDEFLSLVTHEIKNPLTSIKGYASLVEESALAGDQEALREGLSVIRGETAKILRLTEDLLDASKMSAGRFSVELDDVDLAMLVKQVAKKYSDTVGHAIDVELDGVLPSIKGDPVRLSQVVENLVSNAVKYSPDGGKITISLRSGGGRVHLRVKDEGQGIAPDKQPLLFQRFYRVEEGGQTVKGTGLGLFISREIIQMHGGTIHLESTLGEGSCFTVELPA